MQIKVFDKSISRRLAKHRLSKTLRILSIKTNMQCCTLCPLRKPYRNFRIIVENIQLIDRINIVHKFLMKLVKCLMACNWFSKKSDLPLKWEFLLLVVSIRFLILIILRCLENFSM